MQNKKLMLIMSFALAAVLVVGGVAYAHSSDGSGGVGMMNGNGMSNMMDNMMGEGMGDMMEAMNSPEGQAMMEACHNFMSSYGEDDGPDSES